MTRFYLIAIFMLLISCNSGKSKPDVSGIKVDIQIDRFEKSFFKIDTNNIARGLADLRNGFPRFYPLFMQHILQVNPMDPQSFAIIKNIIASYSGIYDSISQKYNSLNWLDEELTEGFKYVKHYYPAYKVPRVITYIGTLDAPGVVLTPDYLGIGLHQYGGKNFSVYRNEQVLQLYPTYISRRFDKEYMAVNCMKAVADDIYPEETAGRPLIEQMIEKGKQWFLLDRFMPDAPDSVKTGYTKQQLNWLKENEGNVWGYIVKNENLYSIEPPVIQTYLGEAPFTQGMPETSPGNIGQWIGWRIVEKYAEQNGKLSVQEVLKASPKSILEEAKYKPK